MKTVIVWNDEAIEISHVEDDKAEEVSDFTRDVMHKNTIDPRWQICDGQLAVVTDIEVNVSANQQDDDLDEHRPHGRGEVQ